MILLSYGPEPYASANSAIPAFIDCSFLKIMRCQQKYVITENRRVQAFFEKMTNFFAIPIYCKKNVPWHILAPSAVALATIYPLRRVRILAERFFFHRTHFPMKEPKTPQCDVLYRAGKET